VGYDFVGFWVGLCVVLFLLGCGIGDLVLGFVLWGCLRRFVVVFFVLGLMGALVVCFFLWCIVDFGCCFWISLVVCA